MKERMSTVEPSPRRKRTMGFADVGSCSHLNLSPMGFCLRRLLQAIFLIILGMVTHSPISGNEFLSDFPKKSLTRATLEFLPASGASSLGIGKIFRPDIAFRFILHFWHRT